MPIEQAGVDVTVKAFFVESKVGKTGLTVTVDVYNPAGSKVVSDASATEVGGGLYTYTILGSSIPTTAGEWVAIFKTATTSVDVQHIPTIWVVGRVAEDVADVETKVDTAQDDLDILTGADGATLATAQGNYAPAKAGDNMGTVSAVTGGINTGAGTITTLDALDTAQDSQHATTQAATTSILAKLLAYFRLLLRSDAGPTTDDATELTAINADGGSGGGNYDPTTDSVEAVRDHIGDGTNLTEAGGDGDHLTEAGGTGDHLTAVPWNASWDAEVQSEVQDAIEANHLDHLLAVDYDPASKPGTSTALLNELVENDGGVSRFTANALEQASAASVDEDAIADAVIAGIGTNNPITIVSPVSGGNRITIYRGADYNGSDLDIIVPGTHDLTSATSVTFTGGGLEESLSVQSSGGTTQTVRMTLTAAETAALKKVEGGYWQIVAVLSSGYTKFISEGTINIRGNV